MILKVLLSKKYSICDNDICNECGLYKCKDKEYNKSLEERMRDYQNETKKLEDREMNDYNTDPNCGGYGIFSGLGVNNLGTIEWNDEEDVKTRYERLLEMRKNDLNK